MEETAKGHEGEHGGARKRLIALLAFFGPDCLMGLIALLNRQFVKLASMVVVELVIVGVGWSLFTNAFLVFWIRLWR